MLVFPSLRSGFAFVCLIVLLSFLSPTPAFAQDQRTLWGVRATFTPKWELADFLEDFDEGEEGTLKGSEISIGFVRGRMLGGDWGVSFVRKPFDDESGAVEISQDCFNNEQTICRPRTETTAFDGVYVNAVEVHWFIPFATIARRAQIGLNVGGGIGSVNGTIITTTIRFEPTGFGPSGPTGFREIIEEEIDPAKDELLPVFPLLKVEAEGGIMVARGLKLKVSGGLNFPAISFRVGVVYFFGAA